MAAEAGSSAKSAVIPKDKLKVGTKTIVCQDAELRGEITIGAGCIIHPRSTIFAYAGPITIGDYCIVEETAVILNRSKKPMVIGNYNHFEVGCRIESLQVGSYNTFEPKCRVPASVSVGDHCVVGAKRTVLPDLHATDDDWTDTSPEVQTGPVTLGTGSEDHPALPTISEKVESTSAAQSDADTFKDHLESYTVVYGSNCDRRTWSGEGKEQQKALLAKHLAYLGDTLPKYNKLKLIVQ